MANYDTNVFEKYGIKEVADVTFYRIDKKKEKYEAQRKITPASILQGELEKTTVYPFELQDDGSYAGAEEGYEAYIFPDADIIKGINYTCDDGVYFEKIPGTTEVTITSRILHSFDAITTGLSYAEMLAGKKRKDPVSAGKKAVRLGATKVKENITTNVSYGSKQNITSINWSEVKKALKTDTQTTYTAVFVHQPTDDIGVYNPINTDGSLNASTDDNKTGAYAVVEYIINVGKITPNVRRAKYYKEAAGVKTYSADDEIKNAEKKVAARDIITRKHPGYTPTYIAKEDDGAITRGVLVSTGSAIIRIDGANATPGTYVINVDKPVKYILTIDPTDDDINTNTLTELSPADGSLREDGAGTHEYTYAEQICMLFAKNQNLIDKRGVRYVFEKANELFGDIDFDSTTATLAPGSTEPTVIVGLTGKLDEISYEIDDVKDYIKSLTDAYNAKAYDVEYSDYCELLVEDEMGFFDPQFLGYNVHKDSSTAARTVAFFDSDDDYDDFASARKGIDFAIANATTWENGEHESINDAIDALRAKKMVIDAGEDNGISGIDRIYGGYKVTGLSDWEDDNKKDYPKPGFSDVKYASNVRPDDDVFDSVYANNESGSTYGDENYEFGFNSENTFTPKVPYRSNYALEKVIEALSKLTTKENIYNYTNANGEVEVKVSAGPVSNRAIYVDVDGSVATATGSFIYLLHNVNYKRIKSDKDGVFKFVDKKGNVLYYQDHIFAGTEYLALVIIGTKGLIFTVGRHGTKDFKNIAWMVSNNGFVTNKQAETLVKAGLIHTILHTEEGETFDATCTVEDLKIRKIEKESKHYTPVLFLDTLKTSTIECAAETTYATGGNGNANLIGWDYGKEITLTLEDALYSPASMNMMWGKADEDGGIVGGVKDVHKLDRFEKIKAKRNFIIPSGNQEGTPSEADSSVQTVYYDPTTMEPFQDGTPIAEGEVIYKWTRTIAYDDNSLGRQIEVSSDGFPGTYRIVGETYARMREGGKDQRFQFEICEAKIGADGMSITLEADGDPAVNADCHNANAAVKCA